MSQGSYKDPTNPEEKLRPPIEGAYYNEELRPLLHMSWGSPIPQPLIDWCDMIHISGIEAWLPTNWERIKHKHVVWRSIGQAVEHTESVLSRYRGKGLKIVRWSPLERGIPGYVGEDAVIRAYADPDEWCGWNGDTCQVITVAQAMKRRDQALKFHLFDKATRGFPRKLYGNQNEDVGGDLWEGSLGYEDLKQAYKDNRVFFYCCTWPAQYTLAFIEAWTTGIPVVAIGKGLAGFDIEVPDMIENGVNGFTSDSLIELRGCVSRLLDDRDLAMRIGEGGRKSAIELFGKTKIKHEWEKFFEGLE